MFKPYLNSIEKNRHMISEFKGYKNNKIIDENEFYYEENLSSDNYPVLSPRNKRAFFNVTGDSLHGLFSKTKLCYINNNTLYYGGVAVPGIVFPQIEKERFFVSMGAKLIVFPDKVYINTNDFSDFGSLEASFSARGVLCSLCRGDGTLYGDYIIGNTAPENPEDKTLWVDTSVNPNILKQYSKADELWVEIEDKFIRITSPGIGLGFNLYDGVFLTGFSEIGLDGNFTIYDKGDDYIVVPGILSGNKEISGEIVVERKLPEMDFICESGNRLWGCSSQNNEIYASKLGDPCNFYSFRGISADSYAVSVGTDAEFTAITSFRGCVLVFKENCLHKIYGQNPPYTLTTAYIRGVQKGSHKSLSLLNETLYYKSPNGICSFDGGLPVDISQSLGNEYFVSAVGGTFLNKYYICMTNTKGERVLFNYDGKRNLWHREGVFDIREFATNNLNLYFIAAFGEKKQLGIIDSKHKFGNFTGELNGFIQEVSIKWCAETGLWGLSFAENKYYSAVVIRAVGEEGATLKISLQYNSDGKWIEQISKAITKTGSFTLPFSTPRCDHLMMKIEGEGNIQILSISRKIEVGSELNV